MRGVVAVLLLTTSLAAHHSIDAVYDSRRPVTIDGTVSRFRFVQPHPFIEFEVRNPAGAVEAWHLEMDNLGELQAVGMTADTLKAGDRLVVTGSLSRSQSRALYVRKAVRPADGLEYEQVGFSPRLKKSSR
jgi:hypothetical protein